MPPRQSEASVFLFDSNHNQGVFTSHFILLRRDYSKQLHPAKESLHFSYKNKDITFFLHRTYQIRFNGPLPEDEMGEKIKKITGTIATDRDLDGDLQPYILQPRIVYEHEPSPNEQPVAFLLTPYPGMEIWDTVAEEVIFSIPVDE